VQRGDVLLVHSNASRLLRKIMRSDRQAGPDLIVDSFCDAVGPDGTVLFPTFNFGFAEGRAFDLHSTSSEMGLLTETARKRPDAVRTGHPIYSFVGLGARASSLSNVCNSSGYGTDSPFGLLLSWAGRIGVLDLPDQGSMTFYHHVEECHQVDYRFHKYFTGPYTGSDRQPGVRTFSLFVRDLDRGVVTNVSPMEKILWTENRYKGEPPGTGYGFRTISARDLFDRVSQVIREGRALGTLYEEEKP
jgi:aminoglycoside 3-N-acetyltransferase